MSENFYQPANKSFRRKLRNEPTDAEYRLWYFLRNRQLAGVKFRRQADVGPYVVDFYAPQIGLVIEVDGDSHFTNEALQYDEARTRFLKGYGLRVLRFTNLEVKQNIDGVVVRIQYEIDRPPPLAPPHRGGEFDSPPP